MLRRPKAEACGRASFAAQRLLCLATTTSTRATELVPLEEDNLSPFERALK